MATYQETFNRALTARMAHDGVTRAKLAEHLKLAPRNLYQRLNGSTDWKLSEIEAVARYFRLDPADVLGPPSTWLRAAEEQHVHPMAA